MKLDIIAGARPNFMKIASVIRAIRRRQEDGSQLEFRLIHTGQHYDSLMSDVFFSQLNIPQPDVNLEVGSGTQAEQTGAIMVRYEQVLLGSCSDMCIVVGDVTSTMACAIAARKLGVPVAHVEAGIRSGDWSMPEELNRLVTDAITDWFFTTSESANKNLRESGVSESRIFFVGNTMIDTLLFNMEKLRKPAFFDSLGLAPGEYFVATLHRPANVDRGALFTETLRAIGQGAKGLPVIFPVHPRTARSLNEVLSLPKNIHFVDPQPYLEFNYLVKHAKAVVTDSGGITEEATFMGVPCMTLRDSTERPETITVGTNELVGTDPSALAPAFDRVFQEAWKRGQIPEKWDGLAGERIVAEIERLLGGQR